MPTEFQRFCSAVARMNRRMRMPTNAPADSPRYRYPHILAASEALKVSRVHLWLVLTGRRQSRSLLLRYQALTRQAGA